MLLSFKGCFLFFTQNTDKRLKGKGAPAILVLF